MKLSGSRTRSLGIIQIFQINKFEILDACRFDHFHCKPGNHHCSKESLLLSVIVRFYVFDDRTEALVSGQRGRWCERKQRYSDRESSVVRQYRSADKK